MNLKTTPNLVVIGGGTGTHVVVSGLATYPVNLTAIVSVSDSGGSTGRLRDEFGFPPVGDLRQALAALAQDNQQPWIRDLLLYRFTKGQGLKGHNLGNLILTALQDLTGTTAKAVAITSQIFRLRGSIYPATTRTVDLVIEYQDGSFVIGEHHLNPHQLGGKKIRRIHLSPQARLFPQAKTAIQKAHLIIIGPGDLYASLMSNLIVTGMKAVLRQTQAKLLYVVNLMTVFTQTHGYSAADHVRVIESAIGRRLDYILINQEAIPAKILSAYRQQQEFPVTDDLPHEARIIRAPLITQRLVKAEPGDTVSRSFLRHNSRRLANQIISLCH